MTRGQGASAGDAWNTAKPPPLRGTRPSAILEQLERDESLELWPRCLRALLEKAWLLEPEPFYLRFLARIAFAAPAWDGRNPPLGDWLEERIEQTAADLIAEDHRREFEGEPPEDPLEGRLLLIAALGVEPSRAICACNRFHDLPWEARRAFVCIGVLRLSPSETARELGASRADVDGWVERALIALTSVNRDEGFWGRDPQREVRR